MSVQSDIPELGLPNFVLQLLIILHMGPDIQEAAMVSPIITNIFVQTFEEAFIKTSNKKPTFMCRYVNGVWPDGVDDFYKYLQHLNFH